MKVVITGGHHTSALPVIKELRSRDSGIDIHWFGHKHTLAGSKSDTLEYKEITALNIPFYNLKAGKLYKTFNPIRLLRIPYGIIQAFILLLKVKPDVIASFGGYLAAPVVLAGWFLGIPSLTHEQTVVTGYSNKFISRFVKKVMISWKESEKYFPKKKVVYTGLPLRKEVFEVTSNSFKSNNNLPTIYITAGKTGSHIINEAIKEILSDLLSVCNVVHQCGDNTVFNDYEDLKEIYSEIDKFSEGQYFLRKFVLKDEIGEAFNNSILVVSRSGAHTTAEILALEKPSILIPIPWVSHNEQYMNAKVLVKYGLSKIFDEKKLSSPQALMLEIRDSLQNLDKYKLSGVDKNDLISKNSAKIIVDEIFKITKE